MPTWFDEMAALVHKREIALAGLGRWQKKLDAAEEDIANLTATMDALRTAPEPAPDTTAQAAEVTAQEPDIRTTFGASEPSTNPFSVTTQA